MIEPNLFEDCQTFIKKDLESWNSYFSRWEILGKYEENMGESELLNEPVDRVKSVKKKKMKMKRPPSKKKLKKASSLIFQKSSKDHQEQHLKMTRVSPKNKTKNKIIEKPRNFKPENAMEDLMNNRIERILKSVFFKFLRANLSNFEMFAVLSQTCSNKERIDSNQLFFQCPQALSYNKLESNERNWAFMNHLISPLVRSSMNIYNITVCPVKDMHIQSPRKNLSFFDFNTKSIIDNNKLSRTGNLILGRNFPKFEFKTSSDENKQHFLVPVPNNITSQPSIQTNFDIKTCHPPFLVAPKCKNETLKQFKLDVSHQSPNNIFRKINKEYCFKKAFPEMNITQDEKRFKKLCLYERANSASLSLENSNFVTLERKPSEQKCFSENILQKERGHPSKLFFDYEKEYFKSDDQTQNQASLSNCRNKIKSWIIPKVMHSKLDFDDCGSIFDRVK